MKKKSLFTRLYLPYIFIIPLVLFIFGIILSYSFKNFYLTQTANELTRVASIIEEEIKNNTIDFQKNNLTFQNYDNLTGIRITIVNADGKVISDSKANPDSMDNHMNREEIKGAKESDRGISIRKSNTLNIDFMYVALPMKDESGKTKLFVRVCTPIEHLNIEYRTINTKIILFLVVLYIIVLVSGYFFSKRIVKPLDEIKKGAERFSNGNFSEKIYSPQIKEFYLLSEFLNKMADEINEKLGIILQQNNLRNAILESMKEGVIAVDENMKILFINSEANKILDVGSDAVNGKIVQEVVRVYELHKFIEDVFNKKTPIEKNIVIQKDKDISLQLTGAILESNENKPIGAIVVINDVTNIFYLDNLKKDFVANVSHELKTPITSIKGFLDTLLSGTIDDKENAIKFLTIISKNTDRLNNIIDDLLLLSKVEQVQDLRDLRLEEAVISDIIKSATDNLNYKAEKKKINLKIDCDKELKFHLNSNLIEQAIINLVDNSIKYSPENTEIIISAYIKKGDLILKVKDSGIGIPKEHLPRLFERFYRIDKARTREEGGTGLGLSIVKHICFVHNGKVEVESEINKGSTFKMQIPDKFSS